jgi:antitoxin component YwqK of YwqJK toxin-antitoxin module
VKCGNKSDGEALVITSSDVIKPIKVILEDSLSYKIVFDSSGRISSILPYRSGILEGNAYEFFANGKLKRKLELRSGRLDGIAQYFYESGILRQQIFFKRKNHQFSKIVYWDSIVSMPKYVYEFDSAGFLQKIKIFDKQGLLQKDSTSLNKEQLLIE